MIRTVLLSLFILTACAPPPEVANRETLSLENTAFPRLVPLDPLLGQVPPSASTPPPSLEARAARLRARADRLRAAQF